MSLELTEKDKALLAGELGPAAKMAMSILVRMADVYCAERMLDITGAHVDSTIYFGDAGLEFAERLAGSGGQVVVPTTLNVSGLDEEHWQESDVPAEWAEKAHRQMLAYQKMGTIPTWTCAPYQTEHAPKLGQQIAWGESNAVVFANSVLGARTECYPDLLDICAALAGRVPASGLHLDENRGGQLVFDLARAKEFQVGKLLPIGTETEGASPANVECRSHSGPDSSEQLQHVFRDSGVGTVFERPIAQGDALDHFLQSEAMAHDR